MVQSPKHFYNKTFWPFNTYPILFVSVAKILHENKFTELTIPNNFKRNEFSKYTHAMHCVDINKGIYSLSTHFCSYQQNIKNKH